MAVSKTALLPHDIEKILLWQVWDHENCTEEANMAKRYSAKLKFQVITELLSGDKSTAQVA